jgi:hypothetical protein
VKDYREEDTNATSVISLNVRTFGSRAVMSEEEFAMEVLVRFKKFAQQSCRAEERLNLREFVLFKNRTNQFVGDMRTGGVYSHFCFDHIVNPDTGTSMWSHVKMGLPAAQATGTVHNLWWRHH